MNLRNNIFIDETIHHDGRAVIIMICDKRMRIKQSEHASVVSYIIEIINQAIAKSKEMSSIEEFSLITQLESFKQCKVGIRLFILLAKTLKILFPDKLYRCYLKDSPSLFRYMFKVIYPMIDKDTRKKISFIKGNQEVPCTEYSLHNV